MITGDELQSLLACGESDRVEFTITTKDSDKFCEAICSFANDLPSSGRPGYLIIGVNDDGSPAGIEIPARLLEQLSSYRDNGQIIPTPHLTVNKFTIDGSEIAVVEVMPSDLPPVRYQGVTHIRVGPRRARASLEEERRLTEKRISNARTWDTRGCIGAAISDLAIELFVLSYLPNAIAPSVLSENQRSREEQLAALRFFDPVTRLPTNAAIMLFGKDPLSYCPGAYVQFVCYDGSAQNCDVLSERRFEGDLFSTMRELDQLAHQLAMARPVRRGDLRDSTVYQYPPIALHELLMNAVIHRNYENSSTPVFVNQYSDRIEISNPGSLYGDLSRDHFPGGTAYRNPIVAEAARVLGFVNRFGRGIAIANAELEKNGGTRAEFDIGDNHFNVVVRAA